MTPVQQCHTKRDANAIAHDTDFRLASHVPQPLPANFVHAEWITLHDSLGFRRFVDFLRAESDRVSPRSRIYAATSSAGCTPRILFLRSRCTDRA